VVFIASVKMSNKIASQGKIEPTQNCMLCIIIHFQIVFGYG